MRWFLLALALTAVSACSSLDGAPRPAISTETELKILDRYYLSGGTDGQATPKVVELYALYTAPTTSETERFRVRNELVLARMYAIDLRFRDYIIDLSQESRQSNFLLKLIGLGLSGAGAAIEVSATQSILAAIDTGLEGASEAFNRDILVDRTVQVLTTQMQAERARLRTEILINLSKSTEEYPLFLALAQVEDFYYAGTIPGALAAVSQKVGAEAENRTARQAAQVAAGIRPQGHTGTSRQINDWISAPGTREAQDARRSIIQSWFNSLNPDRRKGVRNWAELLTRANENEPLVRELAAFLNREHGAAIDG